MILAPLLQHPKCNTTKNNSTDYWNDETQVPVCCNCHFSKLHIMSKPKEKTTIKKVVDAISGKEFYIVRTYKSKWSRCMGGGFD